MTENPYLLGDALSPDECRACRQAMDTGVAEAAEVLGSGVARLDEVRRADSVEVSDEMVAFVEARLDGARAAVAAHFGLTLTGREGAGFLRYHPGGFYAPHVDWSDSGAWEEAAARRVAAVLFLGSSRDLDPGGAFTGGVLRLYPDGAAPIDVVPRCGMLVAFRATTLHEVTAVEGGVRDAVVDWFG
jgi:predicted 2-oxoglutarate/Fe(II)-dependent dioxygenase YbiX